MSSSLPEFQIRDPIFQKANYIQINKDEYARRHLRQVSAYTFNIVLLTQFALLFTAHYAPCSSQLFRFRSFLAMSTTITLFQLGLFWRSFFRLKRGQLAKQVQSRICAYSIAIITINSVFYMFFTFVFVLYLGHPLFVGPVLSAVEQAFFVTAPASAPAPAPSTPPPMMFEQALRSLLYYFPPFHAAPAEEEEEGGSEHNEAVVVATQTSNPPTMVILKQLVAQLPVLYVMSVATVASSMRAYSNLAMSCDAL